MHTDIQLGLSHLGYRPDSPKTVTLTAPAGTELPDRISYYIRQNCFRMPRDVAPLEGFSERFPAPYELMRGRIIPKPGTFYRQGELVRCETRWGVVWQADFSDFTTPGSYQIETDMQVSAPFMIADWIYHRLVRGYLTFMEAQRCGCEIPGVHPACHLDDGVRDDDGGYWPTAGGWHDAGDFRKWLSLTQGNVTALAAVFTRGPAGFRDRAVEEMDWGNRFFHRMITEEGQVFEDVAGGAAPPGSTFTYEEHWWFENHPGCYGSASDNRWTDNRLNSGDERTVRTTYNPVVQFGFIEAQAVSALVQPGAAGALCRALAERAWRYGIRRGHDGRTLFVAQQLLAAVRLRQLGSDVVSSGFIYELVEDVFGRQETRTDGIHGYFLEKDGTDAFRSVTYAGLPAWALLNFLEHAEQADAGIITRVKETITRYCDGYLAADAGSNPFSLTPYGVFLKPEHPDRQLFRDAGRGRGIRTFIHVFNQQGIVHGTSGVLMSHAAVLARAAALLNRPDWRALAERQLQWTLGHNTVNRSLYTGIGYRQPIAYGFCVTQIPEGTITGFTGRPDDTPYIEESFAIEWNTLEYWDVPYAWAIQAIQWL